MSGILASARRIVIKVGSSLVTDAGRGADAQAIGNWCRQLAVLAADGREVVMVSSGAIAEGMKRLGASYVFGSDHSISTLVRYEDFRFALDVYRGHMMNARKEPGT